MKLKVKYFGMIAEAIGEMENIVEISVQPISVMDFTSILLKKHSQLNFMSYKIAVNQTIEVSETMINEGDEIALLPPFAGG